MKYFFTDHSIMPKKEKIRSMFDSIAPDYDKLNHILSLDIDKGWRKKAVREIADTAHPLQVLDVACGTGDFAIAVAKAAAPGSHVTGIDLSEGMMSVGRRKVASEGLEGTIHMEQGDCERMDFADGAFDRVSVAFGVRNFEHREKGLSEMLRVLRPGGKAVILELSVPSNPVFRAMYKVYFLHVLPAIGDMVSGDRGAYTYLPSSVLRFPEPEAFMKTMSSCGFQDVRTESFTCGICRMYTGRKAL